VYIYIEREREPSTHSVIGWAKNLEPFLRVIPLTAYSIEKPGISIWQFFPDMLRTYLKL